MVCQQCFIIHATKILWTSGRAAPAEKGIVLPELSCRTAVELPPSDSRSQLPEYTRRSCRRQLRRGEFRTAAEALAAVQLPESTQRSCRTPFELRRQLTAIPSSSMSFNMDFRELRPKFLSPNSSQPWLR
ncbi:unnamed protein product [Boreogadus saida]